MRRPSGPDATTRLAAVIGSPVRHSLSPALHNAAFAAARTNWTYLAFEVAAGGGAAALDAMRVLGIAGLSVTMPLKEEIWACLDHVDEAAKALRSVNTVSVDDSGNLVGHSTDGAGFVESLRADAGVDPAGARIVLHGAGGAARALVDALARAGAAQILVVNRTAAKAEAAVALAPGIASVGTAADTATADIVVNATSVGMGASDVLPFDAGMLRSAQLVADLVYHPLDTALLRTARTAGARTLDGLGMLVHQAARQQEIWRGERPDVQVMRAAAEAELAAREPTPS